MLTKSPSLGRILARLILWDELRVSYLLNSVGTE
jgi:hypothetical protein